MLFLSCAVIALRGRVEWLSKRVNQMKGSGLGVESVRTRSGSALTWCAVWTQDYQDNNRPASSLTNEITEHGSDQDPHCQGEVLARRRALLTARVPPPLGEGCTSLRVGGEARDPVLVLSRSGRSSLQRRFELSFYGNVVSLKEESEGDGRFLVFRVLLSVFQTPRTMPVGIRSPAMEQGRPAGSPPLPPLTWTLLARGAYKGMA
uniref:Uncharacterized protein n=1 Tax=Timema poppense TaxID=170557 RepID=A0A7R9D981_TIMPO|nr:unnamed protein product [Timema poppensis]